MLSIVAAPAMAAPRSAPSGDILPRNLSRDLNANALGPNTDNVFVL
jgi:hypothetical protein